MNVYAWVGEGAMLVSLLAFAVCLALLVWSYRTHWYDQTRGRRLQRVTWGGVAFTGALLLFNVGVQLWRYSDGQYR